jgi:intracellular sulfur oxidation DsrE/DsrF family protein
MGRSADQHQQAQPGEQGQHGHDDRHEVFQHLLQNHEKTTRNVKESPDGVETLTESDVPEIADKTKEHVEAIKNNAVPGDELSKPRKAATPVISGHGSVVQLADADQQPRSGAKIIVDLTQGGDPNQLNAGLEKVAKYVNIYAGAGAEPADVRIAVAFHGDATLAVLNPDAYSVAFKTKKNPNLSLLRQLHEAGVELYVCGQSLISKGSQPEDVAVFVETAVSALTAVVNLQADGYAYIPLGN